MVLDPGRGHQLWKLHRYRSTDFAQEEPSMTSPVISLRMLVGLKRLDHDPLEDAGEDSGGAITCPAMGDEPT